MAYDVRWNTNGELIDFVSWDDLRFPASAINPPGAASDPDPDTTNGTLLFAASGTELVFMHPQMPHDWKQGSSIKPHVHWYKTASEAGAVVWEFAYKKCRIGQTMDSTFTVLSNSVPSVSDADTAEHHALTAFGAIDMSDCKISDMLVIRLSRLGDATADTAASDVALLECDIHYQRSGFGSLKEYSK